MNVDQIYRFQRDEAFAKQFTAPHYMTLVGKEDPVPTGRSAADRLKALEQLKNDGLVSEEEYNSKRKEILGEL